MKKAIFNNKNNIIHKQDYIKQILFSLNDFTEKGHLLQIVTIPPKTKQRPHVHNKQTEVYYVLEGEATLFINKEKFLAHAGDAFIISPGDKHSYWNKAEKTFKQIVFKINMPENDEDTVWEN